MRRRHYKKRYLPYKRGKWKIPTTLIVILVAAVICFIVAVIIGNVFKSRLEKEDIDTSPITFITEPPETEETPCAHDFSLNALQLSPAVFNAKTAEDELHSAVYSVSYDGYSGLSFTATGKNGKITYRSAAVSDSSGLAPSETLLPMSSVTTVISSAEEKGLRTSAIVYYNGKPYEEVLISELCDMGFDEIVICCNNTEKLDEVTYKALSSRIEKCSAEKKVSVGIALLPGIFRDNKSLPYIEKLYNSAQFMLLDLCDLSADDAISAIKEVITPVKQYEARPLLGPLEKPDADKVVSVLIDLGIRSRQFRDPITVPEEKDKDSGDE